MRGTCPRLSPLRQGCWSASSCTVLSSSLDFETRVDLGSVANADPFWPLGPASAPAGYRPSAEARLDAAARAALCSGDETVSASPPGRCEPPSGVRHHG